MLGLEFLQGKHNGVTSSVANASASLDPKQIPNDATDTLIKGAELAGAGRTLGLSEEETLAATSRQYRRQQQREAYRNRNKRAADWEQKQKTLIDEGFQLQQPDLDLQGDDEVDAVFGRTDYEMGLRNLDADNGVDMREPEYERKGTRTYKSGKQYPIGNRVRPEEEADYRPQVAPKQALQDALSALDGTTVTGAVDARERLSRDIRGGADKELERFLAGEAAAADRQMSDPEMRQYNDFQAEALSQRIARDYFGGYGSGSMADDAIGRMAEIRKLGGAGALAAGEQAQVVRFDDGAGMGDAVLKNGVYYDPNTNNPLAIQGPETPPAFRGANTPNTAQIANAPQPQNASSWIQANLPGPREGGRVFNDYPQVDITTATTNFAQKLRTLNGYGLGNISSNIRSPEELDKVIQYVVNKSGQMGKPLYYKDEAGRNTVRPQAGAEEVMQLLRMSGPEQEQLANALFQIEMSQDPSGYRSRDAGPTPGITFDAQEAINGKMGQIPVERIPANSTIRVEDGKRRNIRAELQGLEGVDAQKPFMGQVRGEKPRVDRRKPRNMGSGQEMEDRIEAQARMRAKRDRKPADEGAIRRNQVKARLAEERASRGNAERADQMSEILASLPPNARRTRIR